MDDDDSRKEPLSVYIVGAVLPVSYNNEGQRAYIEESCRRDLLNCLRVVDLVLLDSAVGTWKEKRQQGSADLDEVRVWWEYRLEGFAIPTPSAARSK